MTRYIFGFVSVTLLILGIPISPSFAESAEVLNTEISSHRSQIEAIEKEIALYERQLTEVGTKKRTLQNTLTELDLQRKKLTATIAKTERTIKAIQLEIGVLSGSIEEKEASIDVSTSGISELIRRLHETENIPLATAVFGANDLTELWGDIDTSAMLQGALHEDIIKLAAERDSLQSAKEVSEEKNAQLAKERANLRAEQGSLDATRKAQNELLAQTKKQESSYQALLEEKQAAKASFESALADLQSRLQYTLDPTSIPSSGKGVLRWPVDSVKVTQYFGDTAFARSGAYAGKGHNGIDLRAPVGTPLKAALAGTILATGNTDSVKGCYSYGKWVVVRHANGLSTLYAHLSDIRVSKGDSVATGEILGYAGQTGYATGPHLHFGVYASSALQIIKLGEATNRKTPCSSATMPVAPLSGYLNPVNYLP
jgi:murein DD-endopeptidase MepM/ murein hydrolase activator NlpD